MKTKIMEKEKTEAGVAKNFSIPFSLSSSLKIEVLYQKENGNTDTKENDLCVELMQEALAARKKSRKK